MTVGNSSYTSDAKLAAAVRFSTPELRVNVLKMFAHGWVVRRRNPRIRILRLSEISGLLKLGLRTK
jgi:DNA-binding transcriptional regulator PaaX